MSDAVFAHDVFLSYSAKDKAVVRAVAERLRADGLRVWLDDWEIKPRTTKALRARKIEDGLEHSRVLVLCMSAHAFGSEWAQLEAGTFRFRDPLNKERRFIPLRLDAAAIKGSLAQFSYINWLSKGRKKEYAKLLEACRLPAKPKVAEAYVAREQFTERALELDPKTNIYAYAFSPDGKRALCAAGDNRVLLWDLETGSCIRVLYGHTGAVVALSTDQRRALSGSADNTVRLWDVETGRCLCVLEGHTGSVLSLAWSTDQRSVLSASRDKTVRLWDVETGRCLRVLEGHEETVWTVAWSNDCRRTLSGAEDDTVRLWDVENGRCLLVFRGHTSGVRSVAWNTDQRRAFSGDIKGGIRVWDLSEFVTEGRAPEALALALPPARDQAQYTNAKVLLVGESGAGKTGLSKRLVLDEWQPSDSTVGAWATQWKLPVSSGDSVEREIWLWDFGGQADQRLIHQLYMDETALAVLVFDGQKDDLFETLGQWDRDLTRASRQAFSKLLVAGRVDAGGLRVSRSQVEAFAKERGYTQFLETSAKANLRCEELKQAILDGIRWENIPWRSSPLLFKRLKEEIVRLKDEGRVLMRFNELRETLQLRLSGEVARFTDEELKTVVSLLAGPGVVWELKFGSWVLLQAERINAYAQAVIQTMRADEHERGYLPEERVLNGNLTYHSSMARLDGDEERFVLLAMHQTLVERGLCLREHTDQGAVLIFPSYYRRERPELVGHPAVLVSYPQRCRKLRSDR